MTSVMPFFLNVHVTGSDVVRSRKHPAGFSWAFKGYQRNAGYNTLPASGFAITAMRPPAAVMVSEAKCLADIILGFLHWVYCGLVCCFMR